MTFALLSAVHIQAVHLHSSVPLFSPLPLKYEGGADEVTCITETNLDDPSLLNGMSSEEITLLANAATDPFVMSPVQISAVTAHPNVM